MIESFTFRWTELSCVLTTRDMTAEHEQEVTALLSRLCGLRGNPIPDYVYAEDGRRRGLLVWSLGRGLNEEAKSRLKVELTSKLPLHQFRWSGTGVITRIYEVVDTDTGLDLDPRNYFHL